MENNQQSDALRLADIVERLNVGVHSQAIAEEYTAAARELRRLDAENEELKHQIAATQPAAQGMDALNQAIEAMQLALSYHGVQLLSYPPQDAWIARGVSEKLRTAISALAAQAKQGGA